MNLKHRIYRWCEIRCGTCGPRMLDFWILCLDMFDHWGWEPPENDVLKRIISEICNDEGELP